MDCESAESLSIIKTNVRLLYLNLLSSVNSRNGVTIYQGLKPKEQLLFKKIDTISSIDLHKSLKYISH